MSWLQITVSGRQPYSRCECCTRICSDVRERHATVSASSQLALSLQDSKELRGRIQHAKRLRNPDVGPGLEV